MSVGIDIALRKRALSPVQSAARLGLEKENSLMRSYLLFAICSLLLVGVSLHLI